MEATSSLSKGCFLFAPAPDSCTSKTVLSGSFQALPGESPGLAGQRERAFSALWQTARSKIEAIMAKQHDQVFRDLLQFVQSATQQLHSLRVQSRPHSSAESSGSKLLPPRLEIPTAVLIAGVNMPDHGSLFREMKDRICSNISPHVVQLRSGSCNGGMKATWKEILMQLMQPGGKVAMDTGEREEMSQLKIPLASLSLLCHWYQESHPAHQGHTPKRKRLKVEAAAEVHRPPVVIIVEDFEGFAPQILQDLIASLSPHLPSFPVVLVLGVATSATIIHSCLPRSCSSLLCIEQFRAQPSTDTLSHVVKEVLLSPSLPFKLGPQTLHLLLHQFLCSNLSITHLSRGLQVAMMEHFHWQPLSVLINEWDNLASAVDALNHNQCEMVRATPSFRKYVDGLSSPAEQISLLEEDKKLKAVVKKQLERLQSYHHNWPPLLLCLLSLTQNLPNAPLGRKLHDLLLLSVEGNISEHSHFDTAWTVLRLMGREGMAAAVERCVTILEETSGQGSVGEGSAVSRALLVCRQFLQELDELDNRVQSSSVEEEGGHITAGDSQTTSERKMMFQERLRQMASRKKEPSPYERARAAFLDNLLQILEEALVPPHSLPLHEVCYFNSVSSLRKHLAAAPRAALHVALSKPTFYLPSASSVSEQSGLSPHMPDICIAYQLHLECGHLINLFDWLCAFVAVVDPEAAECLSQKEGKGSKDDISPTLHARFIQAVSELQLLGFIKPTQRKTDHVQRLTWGAC